jgi:putative hydrolase
MSALLAPDTTNVRDVAESRDPAGDLRTIAYLLERAREPTYRVRAFRTAFALPSLLK